MSASPMVDVIDNSESKLRTPSGAKFGIRIDFMETLSMGKLM